MRFDDLASYFERLEATATRLKMYRVLGELFQKASQIKKMFRMQRRVDRTRRRLEADR